MCHHLWEKLTTVSYLVAIFTVLNLTGCRAITLCGFSLFDKISVESVRQNLTLKETGEGNFYLELNVSWDRPDYDHDGYEVRLASRYSKDLQANIGCSATKYTRTMEESYFFQNLTFGYEYSLWVLLFNSTRNESSYNPALIDVNTPDCFTMTQSLAFCSSQPITVASPARELRAECASSSIYGNTTDIVISWLPPVQVNGSIYEFVISVKKESDVAFEQVLYLDVNERSTDRNLSRRFDQIIENLLPNITYDIELSSLVRKDTVSERGQKLREKIFPTVVTEETLVQNNNSVTDLAPVCILMEQPIETDEQYESPKLSLWAVIGSMAGMTSLMVIMCIALIMSKKRSVAVKRTEFIRYPDGVSVIGNSVIKKTSTEIHPMTKCVDPVFAGKEVDRTHLEIGEELGKGSFGVVFKGLVYGLDGNQKYTPVAVKSLRVGANEAMRLEFLDEIRLIVEIGAHPNVLHLLGCCTVDEPYYLITELMKYGDLLHFLIKCQDPSSTEVDSIYNLTSTMQVQIAIQISRGMEYISSTRYHHGDLAARNVLVGDHLVVKISDFGLADDIYQRGYKRLAPSKKRPVKWVSLETNLEGRCSIESDVWSFGIVLYEIYTLGKTPYENIDGQVVITKLKEGYRLQKPDGCPDDMYTLMLHCWQERPSSRPTFTDIYNTLDTILSESSDYLTNLDPPDKMPFEGGITNPSCFTDETDIGSVNSVDQDRYSSLLITSPSHMDTDSDYSEEGVTTYEIEQITSSMDPRHVVSIPTIIVNSSTPADERKRSTAFINESYESHPV